MSRTMDANRQIDPKDNERISCNFHCGTNCESSGQQANWDLAYFLCQLELLHQGSVSHGISDFCPLEKGVLYLSTATVSS